MLHYNKDIKNAIITNIILMFILIFNLLKYGYAESINQITLKKDKYYICEDISNYSGSPGVDKNPEEFYKKKL